MLASSLLEAVLPLQGWRVVDLRLDREKRRAVALLEPRGKGACCSRCGAARRRHHDQRGRRRRWRELDLFGWAVTLGARLRRLRCPNCGLRTEAVLRQTLDAIRRSGAQPGLSLRPRTSAESLRPFLDAIALASG